LTGEFAGVFEDFAAIAYFGTGFAALILINATFL
jgi:hypothetical protein